MGDGLRRESGDPHTLLGSDGRFWRANNAPMVRDRQPTIEPGYVTDVITDEALRFLEEHHRARPEQPFYLSVHYTAPHSPWIGHPQEIVDSYADCPFESCPQEPRHPWAEGLTDAHLGKRASLQGLRRVRTGAHDTHA